MSLFKNKKSKTDKFAETVKGKSKEEIRKAEERLLKPADLKAYDGEHPKHRNELDSRTALIVFKNKAQQELISEIFSVRTSSNGVTYITDISLLHNLAKMVKAEKAEITADGLVIPELIDALEIPPVENTDTEPAPITSMRDFQLRYFPDDVGKKCFQCGRKFKKKKNVYGELTTQVNDRVEMACSEVFSNHVALVDAAKVDEKERTEVSEVVEETPKKVRRTGKLKVKAKEKKKKVVRRRRRKLK